MKIVIGVPHIILCVGFIYTTAFAQPVYELEPVVVTGSRIPTKLHQAVRRVTIISEEEIESMPVHSVPELLNYLIDIRQRNIHGVQADINIRGTTFEQVLILIDGVPVSDPQTGHHNLDIPLSLGDIERIEIMKGHGSSLYGANAFGGVINIITKLKPNNQKLITEVGGSCGSYGTYTSDFTSMVKLGEFSNRVSIGKQKSDGYRYDTDFDNLIYSFASTFKNLVNVSLGFVDKDFGAYYFYAPFPSKERTKTKFVSGGMNPQAIGNFIVEPKVYYREHYDKFILKRGTPDFYTNYHTNYRYGGELTCYLNNSVFGTEVNEERIKSTGIRSGVEVPALGEHSRQNVAVYSEYRKAFKNLVSNIGGRVDYNSQYGTHISPSLSMGYPFLDRFKLRGSIGKSFRAPSFTELYYKDPSNIGDSTLKAEETWSYESGIDYNINGKINFAITLFMHSQANLIDWVREDTALPWRARNIRKTNTQGIENTLNYKSVSRRVVVEYTFMRVNSELEGSYFSKYVLNYPEHQLSVRIMQIGLYEIQGMLGGVFKKRVNQDGHFTIDGQLSKKIGKFLFSVMGTNLFNTKYEDIMGVEMPLRWITAEVKISI